MKISLEKIIKEIEPVDLHWAKKASDYLDDLAIPKGSLGDLCKIAKQISSIQRTLKPKVDKKIVVTMAGDHGVADEGVSAFPKEVTHQMVTNFIKKGAAINILSEVVGAEVVVVDMGVDADLSDLVKNNSIISGKVDFGTKNMTNGPAMTREQAVKALEIGIGIAQKMISERGANLLATGDMGIGNTTPSSAILSVMAGISVEEATGRGTGINDEILELKIKTIKKAIEVNKPNSNDPIDVLSKVGGFEIAGIAGLILGAAYYRVPVIVDGFISTAGAIIAMSLAPNCVDYMLASHQSREAGHKHMWKYLELKPILNLDLRLGEGTGAALSMSIIESSIQVINKMLTFSQAGVTENVV